MLLPAELTLTLSQVPHMPVQLTLAMDETMGLRG